MGFKEPCKVPAEAQPKTIAHLRFRERFCEAGIEFTAI